MKPSSVARLGTCMLASASAVSLALAQRTRLRLLVSWNVVERFAPAWFLAVAKLCCKKKYAGVTAGAALYSDALKSYEGLATEYAHQVVDHAVQYVDGRVHTNGLENFWSLLKRGISGT